uniref:Uncharacterized protein n=1 Tax=Avena sativa TaxID=4498 RepID=A0ACD6AQ58_AVESA
MAAPLLLLGLLLIASAATADDELPHLELPGIPDSGCAHGSDAPPPQGLMDTMSTSGCGRFAALVATTPNASAVFEERVAAGGGGLTVFCPDDKAVAAFEPTFQALADKDRLAFLLRHGAAGRYGRARFAGFESVTLPTLSVAEKRHTVHAFERGDTMWLWPAWREDGVCSVASTVTKTVSWEEPNLVLHVVDAVILRVREKLDGGGEEAEAEAASGGYYLGWLHHRVPFWWVLLQQLVSTIVGGILGGTCWAGRSV